MSHPLGIYSPGEEIEGAKICQPEKWRYMSWALFLCSFMRMFTLLVILITGLSNNSYGLNAMVVSDRNVLSSRKVFVFNTPYLSTTWLLCRASSLCQA